MLRTANYLLAIALLCGCSSVSTRFVTIPSSESGIHFNNLIKETDSINVLDFENVYNGGGVGVGDFNNDGLPDLYFTGNLVANKLYLNKGDLKFEDITASAGVEGKGRWCRGVAVVDINNDGWQDIYVCATLMRDPEKRRNLLYINNGNGKDGKPTFTEKAAEYGLADTSHSTQAAFFDYDNDGDLDMYLVNNEIVKGDYPNRFRPAMKDGSHPSTDKLFRNDWNPQLKHPVFTDVSKQAGITIEGYGHAATVADINNDGWKDVYVTNDYLSNDLLWINNHDGTFTNQMTSYFKHTSANAMGNDIIDINNDGLADVVALDMDPEDNYRKKMMLNPNSYQTYQNSDYFGYGYQYVRNTLQLNRGPRVGQHDSIGAPVFSEMSFYSGIAETDWSWAPVVADFDNDGNRDIIITNGFPKDVTDHDFVGFRNQSYSVATKQQLLAQIPEVKLHNYAFRNNGDLRFSDVSKDWGMSAPSFSNGAVYVDLDNDGDLDLVVNNINDEASVLRNTTNNDPKFKMNWLQLAFEGDSLNRNGIGALVKIFYDHGKQQVWEYTPFRGYLSSDQPIAHFGLGGSTELDSLQVQWPGGRRQVLTHVKAGQLLKLRMRDAGSFAAPQDQKFNTAGLFTEITDAAGIHYRHKERDFIDFNIQKLIPHKFSEYGPGLAVGDIDGNGLDDIISGGSFENSAVAFLQQKDGKFVESKIIAADGNAKKRWEDLGLLLFDADGDGDLDLYTASGGYENERNTEVYQDKFFLNDGKGHFTLDTAALPLNHTSKFCVRAVDYDKDGDLDLFVSGRVDPWNYPKPVSSFIFRNDSKPGAVKFTDVTATVAKDLLNIGMVCDALFTDVDNDGWPDLMLAGEFMPVTILKNNKGIFSNATAGSGIDKQKGWWNTIAAGDFDNDGDIDYIVGNLGHNSFFRASEKYPVAVTAADFDKNGTLDAIPSLYLPAADGTKKEFPEPLRDDLVKQMISMRTIFQNYKTYANATLDQVLTEAQRKNALRVEANYFSSVYLQNDGHGKFTVTELPFDAQLSVLNGMVVDDLDGDGNLDVLINGNDYGTEVSVGRYDALNGLLLKGDGKGHFTPLSILQSGIYLPGNGKGLVKLANAKGNLLIAASENRGPLKLFECRNGRTSIPVKPADAAAMLTLKTGAVRRQELYYGASFLSQSGRALLLSPAVRSVELIDTRENRRKP
ncbi:MAG: VCBS repeat-containing protein, partial [Chitinophagaceae bacterium]|nr:VCBS repeat-containing protein [Chitinophagaceae bacterium]